ncbi:hypothetical protein BO221_34575 [Archangium sp. Cb G35]|uniref:hypothetical protein n=1 Tax=Archangium sp. Cb G35 TaxID=1920190 RepID=UPI0009363DEC|nr:hypothetical protein [Archangium sp. Cb G35]OJT19506.1 hypothetical protein BO221_34575 [Archangium sp. Cb G35]
MSRTAVALLVLLAAASPSSAYAVGKKKAASTQTSQKSTESKPAEQQPTESKPAGTRPADAPVQQTEDPDMDFDLLEPSPAAEAPRLVDPELEKAIATRRTMLTVHQGLGLATLTTLAATIVVGQLHFDDRYRGGGDTGRYSGWHRGLVIASSTLFVGTGVLGLFAPTPFKKELRLDTITLHKVFVSLATAGMLTQVVLGLVTASREGQLSQVNLATAHQVVGYATLGAVGAGALMIVF